MIDPTATLLTDHRVVACLGPGGVGKTTLSAALALGAARRGARALVLTIDPARRLADAMGVAMGPEPTEVSRAELAALGVREGTLHALMLDSKHTFDGLVERFARDPATRERILSNEIYQHVSDALAGSSEYSAMEKVAELASRGDFDVIVLDTPPSAHALDFLEAPERLLGLIDSQFARRFLHPAMSAGRFGMRLLQRGTEPLFRAVERITGLRFLEELSEFLLIFEEMSQGFRERADDVQALLFGPRTGFVVASGPGPTQVAQALALEKRLDEMHARVRGFLVNRVRTWPRGVRGETPDERAWDTLAPALVSSGLDDPIAHAAATSTRRAFESYAAWARRDAEATSALEHRAAERGAFLRRVPERVGDVHDLAALTGVESDLFARNDREESR